MNDDKNREIHPAIIKHELTNVIVKGIFKQGRIFLSEIFVGSRAVEMLPSIVDSAGGNASLASIKGRIKAYLNGSKTDFEKIPIDLEKVSKFQRAVLLAARNIPYGKTVSYSMLAKMAGFPRAVRAAATVMRKNPVPIIIPCHRVIHKDGSLGAYSGDRDGKDAALKRLLLQLEKEALNK
jgi:methylated-DNA-[protein]-cysteine S-methyltransferase